MPIINPYNRDECLNDITAVVPLFTNCATNSAPISDVTDKTSCHYVIEFDCDHYSNWIDVATSKTFPERIAAKCLLLKKACVTGSRWSSRWAEVDEIDTPLLSPNESCDPCNQTLRLSIGSDGLRNCTAEAAGGRGHCHWITGNGLDDPWPVFFGQSACEGVIACGSSDARSFSQCLEKWWLDLEDAEFSIALRFCSRYGGMSAIYTASGFYPDRRTLWNLYAKSEGLFLPNCLWTRPATILPTTVGTGTGTGTGVILGTGTTLGELTSSDISDCQPGKGNFEECETGVDWKLGPLLRVEVCGSEFLSLGKVGGYVTPDEWGETLYPCITEELMASYAPATYDCNFSLHMITTRCKIENGYLVYTVLGIFAYTVSGVWKYRAALVRTDGTSSCFVSHSEELANDAAFDNEEDFCSGKVLTVSAIELDEADCDDSCTGGTDTGTGTGTGGTPIDPLNPPAVLTLVTPSLTLNSPTCSCTSGCCNGSVGTWTLTTPTTVGSNITWTATSSFTCCSALNHTWQVVYDTSTQLWSTQYTNVGLAIGCFRVPTYVGTVADTISPVSVPWGNIVANACWVPDADAVISW